jgi:hypothetical protein
MNNLNQVWLKKKSWSFIGFVVFIYVLSASNLSPALAQQTWAEGSTSVDIVSKPAIGRPKGPSDYNQLLEKVRREGTVTLIIGLDLETRFQPEGSLIASEIQRQRADISAKQNLLIQEMQEYKPKMHYQYKYIPYISLEVDERGLDYLWRNPNVATIEENEVLETHLEESVPKIGAKVFHDLGLKGSGYTIAIVDTGIDENHPAFWVDPNDQSKGTRILKEACFSRDDPENGYRSTCLNGLDIDEGIRDNGIGAASANVSSCDDNGRNLCYHGTFVTGIAAGNGGVGGINVGVAPQANIIAIQVKYRGTTENVCGMLSPCLKGDTEDLLAGLQKVYEYAVSEPSLNIAAVNISQGVAGEYFSQTCDGKYPAFTIAVDQLVNIGIPVIASSGNDSQQNGMTWPACLSKVISVAAVDTDTQETPYQGNNIASMLDFFAPGVNITSAVPEGDWREDSGTSAAAPHVAGSWVLLKQAVPGASYTEMFTALNASPKEISHHNVTRPRIDVLASAQFLDSTAPAIPVLISPADTARTNNGTPLFEWNGPADAVHYHFQLSRDSGFSDVIIDEAAVHAESFLPPSLNDGPYYWHVSARDLAGNWSGFSNYRTLIIDTSAPGGPPLQSPSNMGTTNDNTPTLDWTAVSGASQYLITVDNNSDFSSPEINVTRLQTQSSNYTPSSALADNQYYWKVRAIDSVGNFGESEVWTFTIDTVPPSIPVLVRPGNNYSIEDTTPYVDWNNSNGNPVQYRIEVDNNSDFSSPIVRTTTDVSYYPIGSSLSPGSYSWRVQAKDSANNWSTFSPPWTFTIITSSSPPASFGKLLPAHQTYEHPTEITLMWESTSSNAALQYCIDQTDDNQCDNNSWQNPTTSTSITLNGLNPGVGYFWQVRATNSYGTTYANSSNAAWWWFVTRTPQSNPLLINEIDVGSVDSVEIYNPNNQSVEMSGWYLFPYDTNGLPEQYYLFPNGFHLSPDAYVTIHEGNGSNSATDLYTGHNFSWEPSNTAGAVALTTSTKGIDFVRWGNSTADPPTETYWNGSNPPMPAIGTNLGRVVLGFDSDNGSDWCTQAPSLGAPNPGCDPMPFGKINPSDQLINQPTNITLFWQSTNPLTKFEYCFDSLINHACDSGWINNGTNTSATLNNLSNSTTYEWHVRSRNGSVGLTYSNNASTSFWVFTTQGPPPPLSPTGISASDGAFVDRVRVSWTVSTGATSYDVYRNISNSSGTAVKINAAPILSSSYDDLTANIGTTYFYWVKACNSNGCSSFSSHDTGTRASSATYEVTNNNASGLGSLAEKLSSAPSGATIVFSPFLAGQTIRPSSTLVINKSLVIDASGLTSAVIISGDTNNDGGGDIRVISIEPGMSVALKNLIIGNGTVPAGEYYGAGIFNQGNLSISSSKIIHHAAGGVSNANSSSKLTILNSTVSDNDAFGVFNRGELTIANSTISDSAGNGIYNAFGVLSIFDTLISNNSMLNRGGGIYNDSGIINIATSTFQNNYAHYGGAIYSPSGTVSIVNSTFYSNAANYYAGSIYNGGDLTINNSTLSDSFAPTGGGIYNVGVLELSNSIVANTKSSYLNNPDDCKNQGGTMTIRSSLIELNSVAPNNCGTGAISADPLLGSLQANGGATPTMALSAGSPAIDAGNDAICAPTDQRGVTRPQGSHCDMGAYEYQGAPTSFEDVPSVYWARSFIGRLYAAGITGGCGTNPLRYCPEDIVTRAQMAVFLLRGIHTSSYTPPSIGSGTGFGDVPLSYWSASFIKQLATEGVTTGCGNGNYCPEHPVTRAQMAVFLLRSKYGSSYAPPAVGTGTGFGDVPPEYWAAAWIKQLVTEGITSGCGNGNYCPENPVTRAQMAVFLVRTFGLP